MDTAVQLSELKIRNQLSELGRMNEWLKSSLESIHTPSELLFRFDLGANEAVVNIISYAFSSENEHEITLQLQQTRNRLQLRIIDDGYPFNPLDIPPPEKPADLEQASIGGLGIDLIRNFIDQCEYRREAEQNILTLTNRLEASAS